MKQKYTVNEILEKGLEVMILKGYANSGINELLKVSDIPKGSFYNHFKSKEDYAVKLIKYYGDNLSRHMSKFIHDKRLPPLKRIEAFYKDLRKTMIRGNFTCGCLLGNMSLEMGDINDTLAKAVNIELEKTKKLLKEALTEAKSLQQIETEDVSGYADYIQNSWHGALLRMKSQRSPKPIDHFLKYTLK